MRTALAPALLAAAIGLAAAAAAGDALETRILAAVDRVIAERHYEASHVDRADIVAQARRLSEAAPGRELAPEWIAAQVDRSYWASLGGPGAVHDPRAVYRLPFDIRIPRLMIQGVGGERSHRSKADYHAFDFVMPIGTLVYASRPGRVVRCIDGFERGGPSEAHSPTANLVAVRHPDGTLGLYVHLSPGLAVKEGQRVKRGELLGQSGNTGYTSGPHLHFVVRSVDASGAMRSIPVEFGGGRRRFLPEPGQYYGSPPPPNRTLRVYADGRRVDAKAGLLPTRRGAAFRLRAELVLPSGEVRDVTQHPDTVFASMTPWSVTVEENGRVTAAPGEGFDLDELPPELAALATIAILHGRAATPDRGLARIELKITD